MRLAAAMKAIALANGAMVRTWGCVEQGDERDTWFWTYGAEQSDIFDDEAEAWRDCCISTGLLLPFEHLAKPLGFSVTSSGFRTFVWNSPDGRTSECFYRSAHEAWLDCCLAHALNPIDGQEICERQDLVTCP